MSVLVDRWLDAVMADNLTDKQITVLLEKFLKANLDVEEARRLDGETLSIEELEGYSETVDILDHEAAEALARNDWDFASHHVDRMLAEEGLAVPRGSPDYIRLCRGVLATERRFYAIEMDRLRGDGPEKYEPTSVVATEEASDTTVSEVASGFLAERGVNWAPKTRQFYEATARLLVEFLGDPPLAQVFRLQAAAVKDDLTKLPPNYTRRWPGKTAREVLEEIVDVAEADDVPEPISPNTVNQYLNAMSAIFGWARQQGHVTTNVFEGLNVPRPKTAQEERDPFTLEELRLLFNAPLYTGCRSVRLRHDPGELVVRDARFWVPLVGLWTGMRLEEICQLRIADLCELPLDPDRPDGDKAWCFRVTPDAGRVKTPAACRVIPVHVALLNLGILAHRGKVAHNRHPRLWPDLQKGGDGYYSSSFSKFFGRFKTRAGVENTKATFHSFRHNVADAFKQVGVRDEVRDAILGHASGKIGVDRYGSQMPVGLLLEEGVRKISYRGLRLGHLNSRSRRAT